MTHVRGAAIGLCLLLCAGTARAEHGSPGDSLHEQRQIPQYGYLILSGANGITRDMWGLAKRQRRLVSETGGRRHVVPLRVLAFYDREIPDFSGAGGYGENCVILQPRARLVPGRVYKLEYRRAHGKRSTWHRIERSRVSLAPKPASKVARLRLTGVASGTAYKTDPSPLITVYVRGGAGKRLWLTSRTNTTRRHFATVPIPARPGWLGECVFHPIAGGKRVSLRFRVADRRGQRSRWSRAITLPAHDQTTVCVIRKPQPQPKP